MITKPQNHWKGMWEAKMEMKSTHSFPPHSPEMSLREKLFDTKVQTELMMNVFGNPPFLRIGETMMTSGEIFGPDGALIPSAIRGCIDG